MGFFDTVQTKINQGVDAAGRTTSTMKHNSQLTELMKKRKELAAQLGASLYEEVRDNPELCAGREDLVNAITAIDAERLIVQAQINALENAAAASAAASMKYTCPTCGGRVSATDMFCAGCGTNVAQIKAATQPVAPGHKNCPSCGGIVAEDDMFCLACGTKLA